MTLSYSTDIVIFGGGVAGLWLLNSLRDAGYRVILFENQSLGSGQTLASQGIIHGGLKYALSGSLSGAANIISQMPKRWRQCLQGASKGDPDLSGVKLLSDYYYMWSDSSITSKLKTFLGSKSLQGRVTTVAKSDYPDFFAASTIAGTLYQLPDFVLDSTSLVKVLAAKYAKDIYQLPPGKLEFCRDSSGAVSSIGASVNEGQVRIAAQKILFCAGEGNQALIEQAGLKFPVGQIRPLNMVTVKKHGLPPVFVHCISDTFSLTPRITITSHSDQAGNTVWYLGGELAESGVGKPPNEQVSAAQSLMTTLFPWINFKDAEWSCFEINRAEANISNNYRPDDAHLIEEDNIWIAWPTKLTLTPSLADKTMDRLRSTNLLPRKQESTETLNSLFARTRVATSPWD